MVRISLRNKSRNEWPPLFLSDLLNTLLCRFVFAIRNRPRNGWLRASNNSPKGLFVSSGVPRHTRASVSTPSGATGGTPRTTQNYGGGGVPFLGIFFRSGSVSLARVILCGLRLSRTVLIFRYESAINHGMVKSYTLRQKKVPNKIFKLSVMYIIIQSHSRVTRATMEVALLAENFFHVK